jgi:hypothetical protein
MNTRALRISLVIGCFAITLAACNSDKKPAQAPGADPAQSGSTDAPQPGVVPPARTPIDTADGTLTIEGKGRASGTWKFEDVTATREERTGAGKTVAVLELEGHNGPANMHFKLRLNDESGTLTPGTYTVGGTTRKADARWESGGIMFNSAFGGQGTVELTSVTDKRVAGTFSLSIDTKDLAYHTDTIRSNAPPVRIETLKGKFDLALW